MKVVHRRCAFAITLTFLAAGALAAQPLPERFLHLLQAPGPTGQEEAVRAALRAQFPAWAKPEVDGFGNLSVTLGSGAPHVALIAGLDEGTLVVSRITADGFLRLHRVTPRAAHPLGEQFLLGQPVLVYTSSGRAVPGVVATPSTHLGRLEAAGEVARLKTVRDLWVDVGAANPREVAALGVGMLDPVGLRERAQPLAGGRVAGGAAQPRAGAQVLVEILRNLPASPATPAVTGSVTFAWVSQSQFGQRGLERFAATLRPDRVFLLGREAPAKASAPPPGWEGVTIEARAVPVRFAATPVELVDTRDIAALAREVAVAAGLPVAPGPRCEGAEAVASVDSRLSGPDSSGRAETAPRAAGAAARASGALAPTASPSGGSGRAGSTGLASPLSPRAVLEALLETYGVSGHERAVREEILRLLPAWAKPQVDDLGNVTVSFGRGGKEILFVAHQDEVGFEIAAIRPDGSVSVRERGGMYLSLYEAHPVLVQAARGAVPAILTPREGYAEAKSSQPELTSLAVDFGTSSAEETRALGVAEGQALTVRKELAALAGARLTGRSMDDRVGSTALLIALRRLDPATLKNRVTFAWSVEEEIGLNGARFLATRLHPDAAFAVDTFVSTDTPIDLQYLAHAELGAGAVLRGLDNGTLVPAETRTRILRLARQAGIPLQVGVTQGGTDASAFSAGGAIDVGLSWPGRYSHSPIEVMDLRDLDALVRLIATLAQRF